VGGISEKIDASTGTDLISSIVESLLGNDTPSDARAWAEELLSGLTAGLALNSATQWGEGLLDTTTSQSSSSSLSEWLKETVYTAIGKDGVFSSAWLTDFVGDLYEQVGNTEGLEWLGSIIDNLLGDYDLANIGTWVDDLLNGNISQDSIVQGGRDLVEKLFEQMESTNGPDWLADLVGSIGNSDSGGLAGVEEWMGKLVNGLKGLLPEGVSMDSLVGVGKDVLEQITSQIPADFRALPEWLMDVVDSVSSENFKEFFSAAGLTNLVSSLYERIGSTEEIEWLSTTVDTLLTEYDFTQAPGTQWAHTDESTVTAAKLISLEDFGTALSWNASLSALALNAVELSAIGQNGKLISSVDQTGTILSISDQSGLSVLRLTLLAPGQDANNTETWAVSYEPFHGLAHPVGGLSSDLLVLPLFVNSTGADGTATPNALTLAITDDGPKTQLASNFLILEVLGNSLLDAVSGASGGTFMDFVQKVIFDENGNMGFNLGPAVQDIVTAAQDSLGSLLDFSDMTNMNPESLDAILDLVSVLVNDDLGTDLKDLLNGFLATMALGSKKAEYLEMVESYLNLTDTTRTVESSDVVTGVLNVDFGFDGAATATTNSLGWETLHGEAAPAAVGWSVGGVQAVFNLFQIRASAYGDTPLTVTAGDDNTYPPQVLQVHAGDVEVMTLSITYKNGVYGYAIEQHTGLGHAQDSVINTILDLVQDQMGQTIDTALAGIVNNLVDSITADMSALVLGFIRNDIAAVRTALINALSTENIVNTFSTDNLLLLPLPYLTMDGDGDFGANLVLHGVKDAAPMVSASSNTLVVSAADMGTGVDESSATGSFTVQSFDGIGTVTANGVSIWESGHSTGHAESLYGELEITGVTHGGGNAWTVNYAYTLTSTQGAAAAESFVLLVADGDGDFAQGKTTVNVTIQEGSANPVLYASTLFGDAVYDNSETEDMQALAMDSQDSRLIHGEALDALTMDGSGDRITGPADSDDPLAVGLDEIMDFNLAESDPLDLGDFGEDTADTVFLTTQSGDVQRDVDVYLNDMPILEAITTEQIPTTHGAEKEDLLNTLLQTMSTI
ncbi:hypothetical protein LJC71_03280, partial [Desulfosarcina sp. OttesenSCG-928-A07]|nr:hypothetical protein [Desulfosarcina sp. OttesenSCG-928-A07]